MGSEEPLEPFTTIWYIYAGSALACVCFAALAAGLTMGLVGISPIQLEIILNSDPRDCRSEEEKRDLIQRQGYAKNVQWLVNQHHWLLVTLLLINAGANEALPIFLDRVLNPVGAILISVTFVLIFGEIIPSAIFTGKQQLRNASAMSPLVYFFVAVCSPIAYPISLLLDYCFAHGEGHDDARFRHPELKAIVRIHGAAQRLRKSTPGGGNGPERMGSTLEHRMLRARKRSFKIRKGGGILKANAPLVSSASGTDADGAAGNNGLGKLANASDAIGPRMSKYDSMSAEGRFNLRFDQPPAPDPYDVIPGDTAQGREEFLLNYGTSAQAAAYNFDAAFEETRRANSAMHGMNPSGTAKNKKGTMATRRQSHLYGRDEMDILSAVLDIRFITAGDACVPLGQVYMLNKDKKLTTSLLKEIVDVGFTRIPVYEGGKHNIRGLLLTKKLILVNPSAGTPVSSIPLAQPILVHPQSRLLDVLNEFQAGKSHLAIVTNRPLDVKRAMDADREIPVDVHLMGILTLEDVIERIIQEPILDEKDVSIAHRKAYINTFVKTAPLKRPSWMNDDKILDVNKSQADMDFAAAAEEAEGKQRGQGGESLTDPLLPK